MEGNTGSDGNALFDQAKEAEIKTAFFRLACIMARLRRPGGCPWDAEQTPQSLKKYVLEEAYEVLEAIEQGDWGQLKEELGDFLFQVMFQAEIQDERGCFDIAGVLHELNDKMVRRHPHVFGDADFEDHAALREHWNRIKRAEKPERVHLFDGMTKGLPALLESYKIGKKGATVGFDWPDPLQVLDKIEEEIREVREAHQHGQPEDLQEELGDLLFAVSNLVRKFGFEPEETLRSANRKFMDRFRKMEELAAQRKQDMASLTLDEQEDLWREIKKS